MSHVMRKPVFAICKKSADQPAPTRSLISAFADRCLGSIMSILAISKISRPWLVSEAKAGWFESNLVANPKDRFSRDEAHIKPTWIPPLCWIVGGKTDKWAMRLWHFPSSVNSFFSAHVQPSSGARYLFFGQTFRLLPYFMCANS